MSGSAPFFGSSSEVSSLELPNFEQAGPFFDAICSTFTSIVADPAADGALP